jgi:flagellar protein FliS
MNTVTAIKTYTNVGLETSVTAADPHKLILLLYQGAMLATGSAKNQILRKEIAAKGKSISHAIKIIEEGLMASLDISAGGELAQNLSALYGYMTQRLVYANLKNDIDALDEVSRLLGELKEAWESISPNAAQPTQLPAPPAKQAALVYGRI